MQKKKSSTSSSGDVQKSTNRQTGKYTNEQRTLEGSG